MFLVCEHTLSYRRNIYSSLTERQMSAGTPVGISRTTSRKRKLRSWATAYSPLAVVGCLRERLNNSGQACKAFATYQMTQQSVSVEVVLLCAACV